MNAVIPVTKSLVEYLKQSLINLQKNSSVEFLRNSLKFSEGILDKVHFGILVKFSIRILAEDFGKTSLKDFLKKS